MFSILDSKYAFANARRISSFSRAFSSIVRMVFVFCSVEQFPLTKGKRKAKSIETLNTILGDFQIFTSRNITLETLSHRVSYHHVGWWWRCSRSTTTTTTTTINPTPDRVRVSGRTNEKRCGNDGAILRGGFGFGDRLCRTAFGLMMLLMDIIISTFQWIFDNSRRFY